MDVINFEPIDPNYAARIKDSFNRQGFMNFINAELKKIAPGYCEIELPFSENLTQQHGFFHAGIVATIADNSSGYAAYSLMKSTSSILTVEFKINLMAPAKGECLIGKSKVIKNGKTLKVCQSEIFVLSNGIEKLCAITQATLIELNDKSDKRKIE